MLTATFTLQILQSELVQREHVGKRVEAGRDERISVLHDAGFREEGSDVGPAAFGGHDDWRPPSARTAAV